jgi:hypothetical protein
MLAIRLSTFRTGLPLFCLASSSSRLISRWRWRGLPPLLPPARPVPSPSPVAFSFSFRAGSFASAPAPAC